MLTDLTVAVQEAINKNLPAEIGVHLQKRLKQAELDAAALAAAARENVAALEKRVQTEETQNRRQRELEEREKKLVDEQEKLREANRELKHTLELAKIRQECAERRTDDLKEVVETVFRAPMTKEMMVNTKTTPIICQNGGNAYQTGSATETHTDTKTAETGVKPDQNR
jgi:hypothetical protein